MKHHTILGGGGLKLHAIEGGRGDASAILFVHGYSQAAWCWRHQFDGVLAKGHRLVAIDLRGHGASDKPLDAASYTDSKLWADDVSQTIAQLDLQRPIVVGWSYGGFIICDLVRHHGTAGLAGLAFCAGATKMGTPEGTALLGSKLLSHVPGFFSNDASVAVSTLGQFIRDCHAKPLSQTDYYMALGYNCATPPWVRQALFSRQLENDDVLAAIDIPALVIHGNADEVVLPASGRHTAATVLHAKWVLMDGVAHAPFAEDPAAFDAALDAFSRQVSNR